MYKKNKTTNSKGALHFKAIYSYVFTEFIYGYVRDVTFFESGNGATLKNDIHKKNRPSYNHCLYKVIRKLLQYVCNFIIHYT